MNKIFLGISVFINLALVASVVGILPFLVFLFGIIAIALGWYIIKLLAQQKKMIQDLDKFYSRLDQYEKHISDIHGLEMFYGDETLQGLIRHSREILNDIYDFHAEYNANNKEEDFDTEETPQNEEEESVLYRETPASDS
jgi:hypothetical protein